MTTMLTDFWYPIARSSDVGVGKALPRRVLGHELALFRPARGDAARVIGAFCPHRGAHLGHGRVVDGCVECPYHGWRFDGAGRCTSVPGEARPARATTPAFPTRESQGLVWTCVGDAARAPAPPLLPQLDDRSLRAFDVEMVVESGFDWWVENIIDVSHVRFVHGQSYGEASYAGKFSVERSEDGLGFRARARLEQGMNVLARLLHGWAPARSTMDVTMQHHMPGITVFDSDQGGGRRQVLAFLCTPEDATHTRMFAYVLRNYLKWVPGGDAIGRLFAARIFREDLALGRTVLAQSYLDAPRPLVSVAADEPTLEFQRLLRLWRERQGQGQGLGEGRLHGLARADH